MRCREALFHLHLPFARRIAGGEHRDKAFLNLDRGDFEQISFAALLEAIDRFDPLVGAPFQAFARVRIKGAIADGLAHASESSAQARYARRVQAERMQSLAPDANGTPDPLSAFGELAALLALGFIAAGLEHPIHSEKSNDPFASSAWRDIEISLTQAINRLPESERTVIENHYTHGVEFTQIARLLGLSKGRISQLHRNALKRLRDDLRRLE
ncbi:MAG: sigma-70 family RNA polymerase sigma factor [Terricaulis sp.]